MIRFGDGPDYLAAAANLCSGFYPDHSSLPFFRAPGLPVFIAATTLCHTGSVWLVKVALAVLGAITAGIIYLLTEELFLDRRAGIVASGMACAYPFFIMQSTDIQTEAVFMFFLVTCVWLSLRAWREWESSSTFLAGACSAAAALTRPVGILLLPLIAVGAFTSQRNTQARRIKLLLLFFGGAICCLGPWVVRNELRFHELIIVNDAGGYNFWRGTSPELAAIDRIADPEAFAQASIRFETVISPALDREVSRTGMAPGTRSRGWYRLAYVNFAHDPGGFAIRLCRNAWVYWRPWLNPSTASGMAVVGSGFIVSVLYILAVRGWVLLWRRRRKLAGWCLVCALAFWLSQTPFQVVSRFRVPVADPFLIAFAGASLSCLLRKSPSHRLFSGGLAASPGFQN